MHRLTKLNLKLNFFFLEKNLEHKCSTWIEMQQTFGSINETITRSIFFLYTINCQENVQVCFTYSTVLPIFMYFPVVFSVYIKTSSICVSNKPNNCKQVAKHKNFKSQSTRIIERSSLLQHYDLLSICICFYGKRFAIVIQIIWNI